MKIFTKHPTTVGETYCQHMASSLSFAAKMILGGFACLAHAIVPFLFEKTGSNAIRRLHVQMVTHRDRTGPAKAMGEKLLSGPMTCQTEK
jgi:hypothetical protein